jgi:inorganic pyrophosphatase
MGSANLERLAPWDPKSGTLNVVIETSRGSRNKLKYDPGHGLFKLSKVLPRGMVFPFDFGFIPSTEGDDGDPLDVLVLLDDPVPAGCLIPARLIGVIEAKQTEDGEAERNDRLIAVAEDYQEQKNLHSVKDLSEDLVREIEHFFVSYNDMEGKRFKPLGSHGPRRAEKLVEKAAQRFREREAEASRAEGNGRKVRTKA